MAIGLIKDCLSGLPGLASSDGHIHSPEIRTFDDLTDLSVVLQALESPFIRAVVATNVGGGLCVYKRDDGRYDAVKWIEDQNRPVPAKPKKIKEGSREWRKREINVLETYAPSIVSCSNCGSPRHKEYACLYCEKE